MREMILAENTGDRKKALAKLLPVSTRGLHRHLQGVEGLPATIRFLDPPLHEFLPHEPAQQGGPGPETGRAREKIAQRQRTARVQPDARTSRLPPRHCLPEISEMQARAVFEAAAESAEAGHQSETGGDDPARRLQKELDLQVEMVHRVAQEVMKEQKVKLNYLVGTMIEVPRGALTADEIAQTAQFFSFGTNDPNADVRWA